MGDQFHLDPTGVAQTAGNVRRTGSGVTEQYNALSKTLDALNGCWGDDDIGNSISENYKPAADKVHGFLQSLVNGFGDYADGLDNASSQFQEIDDESADEVATADSDFRHQLDQPPPA